MKRKISYLFATGALVVCVIGFNGCSMENDYPEIDDLRLERQISMMNYDISDGGLTPNTYSNVPEFPDECILYAFTLLHSNTWSEGNTASDYYFYLRQDAQNKYGYSGGAMPFDMALALGKDHHIINGQLSFDVSNDSISVEDYFQNTQTNNVKMISFYKEGKVHVAKFDSYSKKNDFVRYSDIDGKGQTIFLNEILSVFYK